MTYESNFNADEIFEQLKEVKEGLKALAKTEEEHGRALKEIYKKNVELAKRIKECEEKHDSSINTNSSTS